MSGNIPCAPLRADTHRNVARINFDSPVVLERRETILASRHDRKASILYHSADGIGMALGAVAKFLGNVIARQEAANARNPDRSIKIPQADDSGAFMRTAGLAQARLAVRPVQPVLILRYSGKRARISARYPSVPDRCFRRWRCACSGSPAAMALVISRWWRTMSCALPGEGRCRRRSRSIWPLRLLTSVQSPCLSA